MRTQEEIESKIDELEAEKGDIEQEYEVAQLEGADTSTLEDEQLRFEYQQKIHSVDKQIELLDWVLKGNKQIILPPLFRKKELKKNL